MRKKRDKFLTFMFSLLPGAGHMFMGFMKIGISLMSAFFFTIFLSTWLNIPSLLFVMPMLWFYSFFDCINKRYASDEEFYDFDDYYLFSADKLFSRDQPLFQRNRLLAGVLILLLGLYLMWNNIMNMNALWDILPEKAVTTLREVTRLAPSMLLGIAIIVAGVRLIIGKKKECDGNV